MAAVVDIEGVGEAFANKLKESGVTTQEKLLEAGATAKGRKELAEKSGISDALILKWVNRVDLARIKGIAGQYAELLEAAGVDTVPELATRKPENLATKLEEVNTAKKLVRVVPSLKQVEDWVAQAKALPRVITY
jgi:predicted flap endonuclease-1-like 5' DNA nuclease